MSDSKVQVDITVDDQLTPVLARLLIREIQEWCGFEFELLPDGKLAMTYDQGRALVDAFEKLDDQIDGDY